MPDTTLVSVPSASTFTWLPETLRPLVPSSTTLTVSLCAGPLVADALALALALGVVPCAGPDVVDAWPVNPPMTSTATNAPAWANNGAASFLRSSMTTGGIPSSHGSGATTLSRTWRYCSHHGLRRAMVGCATVGWAAALCGAAACGAVMSGGAGEAWAGCGGCGTGPAPAAGACCHQASAGGTAGGP